MSVQTTSYLLPSSPAELSRLRLQAEVWEPESERLFAQIGVGPGWRCAELGCGAMGVLGPLSRQVGPAGEVVGLDNDPAQLAAAGGYVAERGLTNITLRPGDAYNTGMPGASFDLVHARFLAAPAGRTEELLREMVRLTRPGGVVVMQEPDAGSWGCFPSLPAWERLKELILSAFAVRGGDFNAGRRIYGLLRGAGLERVQLRAAVLALPAGHPYLRLPVQFVAALRERILAERLLSAAALAGLVAAYEAAITGPDTFGLSFTVVQGWGYAPAGPGDMRKDRPDHAGRAGD